MKQSDDIRPTLSQQQKTHNILKDQGQKVYGCVYNCMPTYFE